MYVGEGGYSGAWRLDDGLVMRGPSINFGTIESAEAQHPTGAGVDLLIKALSQKASDLKEWIGEYPKEWNSFTALPMLYPRNTGLYWHRDSPKWTGSYTYYAHTIWNIEWGGALLIGDESLNQIPDDEYGVFLSKNKSAMGLKKELSFGAFLDNHDANELLMAKGMGTFIMPKPNRLVIIAKGNPHSVSKVLPAAGDHVRMSISGFFRRPK